MAKIIDTKPIKHTTGATFMRMGLKMSGLNVVSVEPLPLISMKPIITTNMPAARQIKLVLSNARFFLSILLVVIYLRRHACSIAAGKWYLY